MDLPQIGAHCARCKTLDLLPLRCPGCGQVFCREHSAFASHDCPEPVEPLRTSIPVAEKLRPKPCELPACSKPRLVISDLREGATAAGVRDIGCPACGGFFCFEHRASHSCKPLPPADAAAKERTRALIAASFSTSSPSPSPSSSRPTPPPPKRPKRNPVLELMRLKQFAKPGRGEVPQREDRWHLRMELDLKAEGAWRDAATRVADKKLEGTYWKKDLTVGQIQQATISQRKISYNPIAGDPSTLIHLVHIPPDDRLPTVLTPSTKISDIVEDGAWVVLVKGSAWQTT